MAKPTVGTPLNTTNPFYTSLTNAWGILEHSGTTLTDSKSGNTITLGGGWSLTPDVNGDSVIASPSGMSICTLATPINLTARETWSLAWKMVVYNNQSTILGNSAIPNDSYLDVFGGSSGGYYFRFINTDGAYADTSSATMGNPAVYHNYILTSSGTFLNFFQDISNFKSSDVFTSGSRLTINCFGGGGSTSTWFYGYLSYLMLWQGRILSQSDVASFIANPWQLFGTSAPPPSQGGIMLTHM